MKSPLFIKVKIPDEKMNVYMEKFRENTGSWTYRKIKCNESKSKVKINVIHPAAYKIYRKIEDAKIQNS